MQLIQLFVAVDGEAATTGPVFRRPMRELRANRGYGVIRQARRVGPGEGRKSAQGTGRSGPGAGGGLKLPRVAYQLFQGAMSGSGIRPEGVKNLLLPGLGPKGEGGGEFQPPLLFGGNGLPARSDQSAIDADI